MINTGYGIFNFRDTHLNMEMLSKQREESIEFNKE
jgi:hypothetical protein